MKKKLSGGQAPYGYRWKEGSMQLDPHEMPVRQYIYELFIQHKRKKAVVRILNNEGYRTRRRARFSSVTIDRIIRDPIGKGLWRTGHTNSPGRDKQWTIRSEKEWHYQIVPSIVSEQVWLTCQDLLDNREQLTSKKETRHLFRDFIVCYCGARMKVPSRKAKYLCPSCANSIEKKKVEDIFISQVEPFKIKRDDSKKGAKRSLKKRLLLHLAHEATTIQTLIAHYKETEARESPLELTEQLEQIKITIPKLEKTIQELRNEMTTPSQIVSLKTYWPRLSFIEKMLIIEQVLKRVTVGESEIKIAYSKAPYTILHPV